MTFGLSPPMMSPSRPGTEPSLTHLSRALTLETTNRRSRDAGADESVRTFDTDGTDSS